MTRLYPGLVPRLVRLAAVPLAAPHADQLTRAKRWPSAFGSADQRGAAHRLDSDAVSQAARSIAAGTTADMARVVAPGMPFYALSPVPRRYRLAVPGTPTCARTGENARVCNAGHVAGETTPIGFGAGGSPARPMAVV